MRRSRFSALAGDGLDGLLRRDLPRARDIGVQRKEQDHPQQAAGHRLPHRTVIYLFFSHPGHLVIFCGRRVGV